MASNSSNQLIRLSDANLSKPIDIGNPPLSLTFVPQRALEKEEEHKSTRNDAFCQDNVKPLLHPSVPSANSIDRVVKEEQPPRPVRIPQGKRSRQLAATEASASEQVVGTVGPFGHILSTFSEWNHARISATPRQTSPTDTNFSIDINFTTASMRAWAATDDRARTPTPEHTRAMRRYNLRPLRHSITPMPASAVERSLTQVAQVKPEDRPNAIKSLKSTSTTPPPRKASQCLTAFHEKLIRILPIDTRQQLREKPRICVAMTDRTPNSQCTRATGTDKNYRIILNSLVDLTTEPGDNSTAIVRRLLECALCGNSHRRDRMAKFDTICAHLDDMSEDDRSTYDNWIKALISESEPTTDDSAVSSTETADPTGGLTITPPQPTAVELPTSTRRVTRSMTFRSLQNRTSATAPARNAPKESRLPYFQNFKPYQPKSIASRSISTVLRDLTKKPLTKSEEKSGLVYMYWFPGNFGYVKIGITTRTETERLKEWERGCKHSVESVSSAFGTVAHVYRVEMLVHRELKEVRCCEVKCRGCGKNHKEWFRESPDHARRVYEKWEAFMKTAPYVEVDGEWRLREDITEEEIERLCQPLERTMASAKRTPLFSSRRRTGGKVRVSI